MSRNIVLATLSLLIVAFNSVHTQISSDNLQPHNQPNLRHPSLTRARRMYALCPPDFTKIGNDCYYLSSKKESWLDAHFECKDRNSKLAEPLKFADRRLRKYLKNRDRLGEDKWIGGMYNWQQMKWQWGYNGGEMKYMAFGDEEGRSDLQYHCTTMDPKIDYQWSAKLCIQRHFFICQHRMSYVSDRNRQKVYAKWNETYPNQLANEVEVYVSTSGNNNRSQYRNVPKKNRPTANRGIQLNNQISKVELTDNAPDYLPYSIYGNLEQLQQKAQEDTIHPLRSSHAENSKQPALKPRKRHSRPLKLTGEVNLGTDQFKHRERKQRKKKKPVEVHTNEVDSVTAVTNPGRHHHHPSTASEAIEETTTPMETTTEEVLIETTQTTTDREISEVKRKQREKADRRERLKQKLMQLSLEERQAFLLMKQQRADARKKGLTYGH